MISKIDKDGNSYGKSSIVVISSDGKVKTVSQPLTIGTTRLIGGVDGTLLRNEGGFVNDTDYTVPKTDGSNGQVLQTNGAGVVSWSTISTGITVGTTPITSGVDGRVLFQSGGVVSQDSGFFWDNTNKRLGVGTSTPIGVIHSTGSITASSGIGRGVYLNNTVVASANNNTLVGVDVDPTLNTAGFGGVTSYAFRVNGASIFTNNISIGNGSLLNGMVITANSTATGKTIQTYGGHPLILNGLGNNVTIGATTAGARLDVRAQGALSTDIILRTRNSADTRNFLVVNGAGDVFNNGAGGVTSNTFYGENSGRNTTSSDNTFFGASAGQSNTTGNDNSFFGRSSGLNNTTGFFNSFFGRLTGNANTTGFQNSFFGRGAGQNNSTADSNSFFGAVTGESNNTGRGNSFFGQGSGQYNTTGSFNSFFGRLAGRLISSGANLTIANNSTFIGYDTRANADNETNQIVIGHNAIGLGSNTVVLGNDSIVTTQLRGTVRLSLQASAPAGVEGAIYYDSTTKKHYGHDGTSWNALY
jgi:hypothetical protein